MKRILVAEDDTASRDLLTRILGFYGFATLRATNGRQAIQITKQSPPDLIMMDVSMPIQNGLDAVRELKQRAELAHIPVVAMSAYDSRQDQIDALNAGCVAFFPKPLELFRLKEELNQIIDVHRLQYSAS
ncbi:MAG: response regulator [Ardenticatenaceae bacterium]